MNLVYRNESTLQALMLAVSLLAWGALALLTQGVALAYALALWLACCMAQSSFVAYLRGTGVRITASQFPDLHARLLACCERLELDTVPEAYLLQMGGRLQAHAARFLGRHVIVLSSDVVEALDDAPDAINFYIGRELGHVKRHRRWAALLAPAALLPLLGAAHARARVYTCDRHGFHACDALAGAQAALAVLAAGRRRQHQLDLEQYVMQARASGGFWPSFHELTGDQPWLVKRMAVVRGLAQGMEVALPQRHGGAYLLALCVPRLGRGAGPVLALLALAGVLAAFALPAWDDYQSRQQLGQAVAVGREATAAVERYFYANGQAPATLDQAGYAMDDPSHVVRQVTVDAGNGVVRVWPSAPGQRGRAIAFTPRVDENKRIVWRCSGEAIAPAQLPADCRD